MTSEVNKFMLFEQPNVDPYWLGRVGLTCAIWGLYALACILPAVLIHKAEDPLYIDNIMTGATALATGWLMPPFCLVWTANVWLLIGWGYLLAQRYKVAATLGSVAVAVALVLWLLDGEVLLIGYWFWVASMATLDIGASFLWWKSRQFDQRRELPELVPVREDQTARPRQNSSAITKHSAPHTCSKQHIQQ